MLVIYMQYPHLLDEAPGLGDLKTAPPRPQGYVSWGFVKLCPRVFLSVQGFAIRLSAQSVRC